MGLSSEERLKKFYWRMTYMRQGLTVLRDTIPQETWHFFPVVGWFKSGSRLSMRWWALFLRRAILLGCFGSRGPPKATSNPYGKTNTPWDGTRLCLVAMSPEKISAKG